MPGRLALIANIVVLGLLVTFGWLAVEQPDLYYRSVQEDQALEWASFWGFFIAGGLFIIAAARQRRRTGALPWFLLGLAGFCLVVAMEEISWGQRVFGHRPPDYFLAENFQQELNLHNIAGTGLRLFAFRSIVVGYGVLLPLLALVPAVRRFLERVAIVPPPMELAPSMFAIWFIHWEYPWKFTGEICEAALAVAFLFAAAANAAGFHEERAGRTTLKASALVALVALLGWSTAVWSQHRQSSEPEMLELARQETGALRDDLRALAEAKDEPAITKCGVHKRLYTLVQQKKYARRLPQMSFAGRVSEGLPRSRAEYFLDPWNSPYWVRDRCDEKTDRRVVFVYSFGPNRSRDSSRWEILGDDIGQYVLAER